MTKHSQRSLQILVVDDEELVCLSIRMVLKSDGHVVTIARSGEEALAIFKKSRFDMVLTDYSMSGMKGTELAVAVKAAVPSCPVVMITAYAQSLPASLPGVERIIGKPFSREELRDAIAFAGASEA